jgi:hypothetical protein
MSDITSFVGLSQVLTGIPRSKLAPSIDPTPVAPTYLETLQQKAGATLTQELLQKYESLRSEGKSDEEIGKTILSDPTFGPPARNIMKMWYLGSWIGTVISSQSYTEGWVWKVMQAHPMGYSVFHFGYWAENPPGLEEFTGVDNG